MHGYLKLTCLIDPLTRERKDEVYLTLVRWWLSSIHNAYIDNGLHIVLRLLHEEIIKQPTKHSQFPLKKLN